MTKDFPPSLQEAETIAENFWLDCQVKKRQNHCSVQVGGFDQFEFDILDEEAHNFKLTKIESDYYFTFNGLKKGDQFTDKQLAQILTIARERANAAWRIIGVVPKKKSVYNNIEFGEF